MRSAKRDGTAFSVIESTANMSTEFTPEWDFDGFEVKQFIQMWFSWYNILIWNFLSVLCLSATMHKNNCQKFVQSCNVEDTKGVLLEV